MNKTGASKIVDYTVLAVLLILFVLKFGFGGCRIWICIVFTGTITAWLIYSDKRKENKNDS